MTVRIVDIRERTVSISRYADPSIPPGGLTTSLVAVIVKTSGSHEPVVGYGFSSIGRYGQGGLIRERFAPRLLSAAPDSLAGPQGRLDPFRAWDVMLSGEKPGGHGERCVAVGTLDMAIWDAAAKLADLPLDAFMANHLGEKRGAARGVPVYASGGYVYPRDDIARLKREVCCLVDEGYTRIKIKIGALPLVDDLKRIEAVLSILPSSCLLAVDAMNAYGAGAAERAASALAQFALWWLEDVCDPLDFETQAKVAAVYEEPLAAGEALFSVAEAKLLDRHGGLRRGQDILLFDPVHSYGIPGYLRILEHLTACGWPRSAFWPHGGHLFNLHLVSALGLGGTEVNPLSFQPFGGLADGVKPINGAVSPPDGPGIGFESKAELRSLFEEVAAPARHQAQPQTV